MGRPFGFNDWQAWGGILPDGVTAVRSGKYLEVRGTWPLTYHHQGEDLAVWVRTQLLAPFRVTCAYETNPGDGNSLTDTYGMSRWFNVDGGGSFFIAHLIESDVHVGDVVEQDGLLGLSGGDPTDNVPDGSSTGPHVHVQCNTSDTTKLLIEAIDPLAFLTLVAARQTGSAPPAPVVSVKDELVGIADQARQGIPSVVLVPKLEHAIGRL